MFLELGRVIQEAKQLVIEQNTGGDVVPAHMVKRILYTIECQAKMTERQIFEAIPKAIHH